MATWRRSGRRAAVVGLALLVVGGLAASGRPAPPEPPGAPVEGDRPAPGQAPVEGDRPGPGQAPVEGDRPDARPKGPGGPKRQGPGRIVRGLVRFDPPPARPIAGAVLRVYVEDVSRYDLRATRLATLTLEGVTLTADAPTVRFVVGELHPETGPAARYSVRIDLDLNANGKVDVGDYYTLGAPVFTATDPEVIETVAKPVVPVGR